MHVENLPTKVHSCRISIHRGEKVIKVVNFGLNFRIETASNIKDFMMQDNLRNIRKAINLPHMF